MERAAAGLARQQGGHRLAGQPVQLQRALDALRVRGMQPRRGDGVDLRELGVQRRPAVARGFGVDLGAQRRVGAGQVG